MPIIAVTTTKERLMTRFHTSDTHFGHFNILNYSNRPFGSVQEMNEALIDNWNSAVRETDTVIHHGDVAMGPWAGDEDLGIASWDDILTRLNGYKILIVGNHDRIFKGMSLTQQHRFAPHYAKWFHEVHHNYRGHWLDNGVIVDLSHFPYDGDSHDEDRYNEHRLYDGGRILIHGHTHAEFAKHGHDARVSRSKRGTKQIHVGVDAWDYRPVSEDEIIDLIEGV
jgi:calcineurin-like phosphoesterase family protein